MTRLLQTRELRVRVGQSKRCDGQCDWPFAFFLHPHHRTTTTTTTTASYLLSLTAMLPFRATVTLVVALSIVVASVCASTTHDQPANIDESLELWLALKHSSDMSTPYNGYCYQALDQSTPIFVSNTDCFETLDLVAVNSDQQVRLSMINLSSLHHRSINRLKVQY
jgi:hypothetical protein